MRTKLVPRQRHRFPFFFGITRFLVCGFKKVLSSFHFPTVAASVLFIYAILSFFNQTAEPTAKSVHLEYLPHTHTHMSSSRRRPQNRAATQDVVVVVMILAGMMQVQVADALLSPSLLLPRSHPTTTTTTTTALSMSTPPPRKPRRELKKRRRREDNKRRFTPAGNTPSAFQKANADATTSTEYRPLVPSVRRDLGEDYWIDPADLEREQQRQQDEQARLQRRKKAGNDVIPKEKLWDEVKAPYQQNWIGYFSVFIAILSVIVLQFPELLDTPTISYPDL
jgi:hypothetical protein